MAMSPLADLLGGGTPQSAPQVPQNPPPQASGDAVAHLRQALENLKQAEAADSDPSEEAAISQIAAKLKGIIAGRAKERDAAIGITPALRLAQRQAPTGATPQGGPGY